MLVNGSVNPQRLKLNRKPLRTCFLFDDSRSFRRCLFISFRNPSNTKGLKARTSVIAGYTKIPVDTSGAYQLIDDESREDSIFWGVTDDDGGDSPVPSKDVLSWNPSRKSSGDNGLHPNGSHDNQDTSSSWDFDQGSTGIASVGAASHSISVAAHAGGLAGQFRRLKTDRVKVLARKTSTEKREINEHGDRPIINSPSLDRSKCFRPSFTNKKKEVCALKRGESVSQILQSQDSDIMRKTGRAKYIGHSDEKTKNGFEAQEYQVTPAKAVKYDDASVHNNSHVSRWGDVQSLHKFRTETTVSLKGHEKLSTDSNFFSRKSFKDLGCSDYMIESLRGQLFFRPSRIQAMAFSPVVEGKSCIITDQSGSGKTLAYLIPVIQRLRQEELQGISKSLSRSPRVVILVPTAELASQVSSNCRSMSKNGVPFRSMVVTGGFRQRTQLENLQQDLDILIATPGRFMFLIKEGFLQLTNIRCAVLDEVDIHICNEDFDLALQSLIKYSSVTTQYLFVTATLPIDSYNKLLENFPDCEVIMGPGMHRVNPGLEEVLVDCSGDGGEEKNPDTAFLNKKSALLQLVEGSSVSKTIVFCNKIETCRKVENILKRYDRKGNYMRVSSFHAALTQESRLANMKEFLNFHSEKDSIFLVCTDRASRGIDFAGVDRVILFDFPRDPSEYVRRVGRTARGPGRKGKAFIFVVGKQVSLARRILERNQKGQPLHDVPSVY